MAVTKRSRTIAASPERVWDVVADPWHLPRWWPRVERVEGVEHDSWTMVLLSQKGATVRADYRLVDREPTRLVSWRQETEDSPFERLLAEAVTRVSLEPQDDGATRVRIELRQRLRGLARLGALMVRSAARRQLDEALEALDRCVV